MANMMMLYGLDEKKLVRVSVEKCRTAQKLSLF